MNYIYQDFDNFEEKEDYGMDTDDFVNAKWDGSGSSLIHLAVNQNNKELLKKCIEFGGNINSLDQFNCTALFYIKNFEMLKLLLDFGCDPNIRGIHKWIKKEVSVFEQIVFFEDSSYYSDYQLIIDTLFDLTKFEVDDYKLIHKFVTRSFDDVDLLKKLLSKIVLDKDQDQDLLFKAALNKNYWEIMDVLIQNFSNSYLHKKNAGGQDFYDVSFKYIQKLIDKKYPDFIKEKKFLAETNKYNL